jgi:mRNA-degrading endonuclease RelE of RelBE toxin-antitoxin system
LKTVEFDHSLLEQIRALPKPQRREVGEAIVAIQAAFGQPYQHTGLGLRKLRGGHYEVRLGLGQRLVFEDRSEALYFKALGNHGTVQRFLRGLR